MRPIDADALKSYIDAQVGRPFIGCTVGEALKIMTDEQPTIEPKRGKWVDDGDPLMLTCGNCGYAVMRYNNTPFCPNCGAKMEK